MSPVPAVLPSKTSRGCNPDPLPAPHPKCRCQIGPRRRAQSSDSLSCQAFWSPGQRDKAPGAQLDVVARGDCLSRKGPLPARSAQSDNIRFWTGAAARSRRDLWRSIRGARVTNRRDRQGLGLRGELRTPRRDSLARPHCRQSVCPGVKPAIIAVARLVCPNPQGRHSQLWAESNQLHILAGLGSRPQRPPFRQGQSQQHRTFSMPCRLVRCGRPAHQAACLSG